jgi:hypothetical protein
MSEREREEIKKVLKSALPPMGDAELRRDLWPEMLKRMDRQPMRVPWWDWVLLAGASVMLLLFPGVIPALLYHL